MNARRGAGSVALAATLMISALGGGSALAAADPVEIELLWHGGAEVQAKTIRDQVDDFNSSQSDVIVALSEIPTGIATGGYTQAVSVAALAGDLPCIVSTDSAQTANFAWADFLVPLDDYISPELKADLLPSIVESGTYDGKLYNLLRTETAVAITARKSLLEKIGARIPAGIEDPWTLDEFNDILTKLEALPELDYAIDMKMNYGRGFAPYGYQPIVYSFGGSYISPDLTRADGYINGPETVAAYTWMKDLFDSGKANANPVDDNDFINGKTGLALSNYWLLFGGAGISQVDTWGDDLLILPMPDFGQGSKTNVGDWGFAISAACPEKDAAWQFIEWAFSPEEISRFAGATGAPPALRSALEDTNWAPGNPANLYIQQIDAGWAAFRPATPAEPLIETAITTAFTNIIDGDADIQAELDAAADTIDADLAANDAYGAG